MLQVKKQNVCVVFRLTVFDVAVVPYLPCDSAASALLKLQIGNTRYHTVPISNQFSEEQHGKIINSSHRRKGTT